MTEYEAFARAQLPRLLRYAVMLTGERELAADLVQDVLVKVFRRWSRVSAADRPDRYVMQMVTNQYLSWRRRWAVRTIYPVAELPDSPYRGTGHATPHALRDDLWARLTQLLDGDWANASAVDGGLVDFVRELKGQAGGDIGVHASISVAQALLAAGVVDELKLVIAPAIAGAGKRLLDGLPAIRLEPIKITTSPSGHLLAHYRVVT